uniref:Uncharacterized protein n=1 Tax=Solanum tuberosum TaxID=4113 RepID=M1AS48_SOLTU
MDSSSDSQVIRRRKGPAFEYLVPLIYAPALPLNEYAIYLLYLIAFDVFGFSVRIALRHKPVLRDRLFYGVLAGAFAHGTYLVYPLSHPF